MVRIRVREGLRAVEHLRGGRRKDGKASKRSAQGGDSGHSKGSKRKGNVGGGPLPDGLPWIDRVALVPQVQEDCGGTACGSKQPVGENCALRHKQVDSSGRAQGLQFSKPEQRNGNVHREVCGG